jgi:hypothetical protein
VFYVLYVYKKKIKKRKKEKKKVYTVKRTPVPRVKSIKILSRDRATHCKGVVSGGNDNDCYPLIPKQRGLGLVGLSKRWMYEPRLQGLNRAQRKEIVQENKTEPRKQEKMIKNSTSNKVKKTYRISYLV